MSSLKKNFGKRVKEIRKSHNLTQEMLASKLNVDPPNISKIECGKNFVTPQTMENIAKALNVELKEFFDFGHIKTRQELINAIIDFLEISSDADVIYYYRMIQFHKETR